MIYWTFGSSSSATDRHGYLQYKEIYDYIFSASVGSSSSTSDRHDKIADKIADCPNLRELLMVGLGYRNSRPFILVRKTWQACFTLSLAVNKIRVFKMICKFYLAYLPLRQLMCSLELHI